MAPSLTRSEKVASYLNKINPIPALPEYSGPYKVGTTDVEIPVSDLHAPSSAPSNASDIHTVQFRIFYPAQPDSQGKAITWLPHPQRSHISAYTKFLGIGPFTSELLSFLPRHVHYTTIPVHKNATILEPEHTPNRRWPTMIFSHGLGGSRNAYSHIAGSMASHGVVVICPEHRDGSAIISFIRDPVAQKKKPSKHNKNVVPYVRIPHDQTPEVWHARNQQLKVRLWELGLIHEAILDIDSGLGMNNLNSSTPPFSLNQFSSKLNVHEPGSIIFGGHSFGAATMVQLLKSTYYAGTPDLASIEEPLFIPAPDSRIRAQITPGNLISLLDMWCFPLLSPTTSALYRLPLPAYAYADSNPVAPGGGAILAIESGAFVKWNEHLHATCRIISPDPAAPVVLESAFERSGSGAKLPEPNFFYVVDSAHLNQSDFGVLFPWLTKKVFASEQPERALRLNVRALLQHFRTNGVPVARTWSGDLVDGVDADTKGAVESGSGADAEGNGSGEGIHDDKAIFDKSGNVVDHWKYIDIVGMGGESGHGGKDGKPETVEGESEMETEIEMGAEDTESAAKSQGV